MNKQKQPSPLSRLMEYAGGYKILTYLSWVLSFISALTALLPLDNVIKDLYQLDDKALSLFRNRHIGMIPQGSTALTNLNVLENVISPALIYGKRGDGLFTRANELLKTVGIAELADAMPNELSGGELRRMAIARALMNSPDVILADEPTGDLDDENTEAVQRLRQIAVLSQYLPCRNRH